MKRKKKQFKSVCLTFMLFGLLCTGCADNKETSSVPETTNTVNVLLEDYYVQIPCEWTIDSAMSYRFEGKPVLQVEVNAYDEATLKEEFGYTTTEECINGFLPNGIYEEERKTVVFSETGLQGIQVKCTADQYSETEDCFVATDDIVYLVFVPDCERQKLYTFYFMNDMAEESKISEFCQTMELFDHSAESMDGAYRWMMEE